jgi:hypothetical protein
MTFTEWINFEADRIVAMGLRLAPEHQADYMRVQIVGALRKALAHGRDALRIYRQGDSLQLTPVLRQRERCAPKVDVRSTARSHTFCAYGSRGP